MTKVEKIPGHTYTDEEIDFLKQNCVGKSTLELTELFNINFKTNLTNSQIRCKKKKLKLKSGVVTRFQKGKESYPRGIKYQHQFTKEELQFLRDNTNLPNWILTENFNKQFKTDLTIRKIISVKERHKIKGDGVTNAGGRGQMFKTGYKKGNIPALLKPLGSERKTQGYVFIKAKEHQKENFVNKARYIYEQTHGKIKKGYKVIFADGNSRNFDIDNLVLVKNSEHLILNQNKLRFDNKELTKSGVLVAKLIDTANKKARKMKE